MTDGFRDVVIFWHICESKKIGAVLKVSGFRYQTFTQTGAS